MGWGVPRNADTKSRCVPRTFLPPALRRSTYRAPDPAAASDFDPTQPPGDAEPDDRRAAALAVVRAELDLPEPEATVPSADAPDAPALEATRPGSARSTFTPATTAPAATPAASVDSTVPDPAEPTTPAASVDSTVPDPAEPTSPAASTADAGTLTDGVRTLGETLRFPRHRADRLGNRRPSSGPRRSVMAACAAFVLGGALAGGALVNGMDDPAMADASARDAALDELASSAGEDDVVIPPVTQAERAVVTTELSASEAPFTGGTKVTVEGRNLDRVSEVTVAGTPATIVESDADTITFAVPEVDDSVRGDAEVVLADADGSAVDVEVPVASAPASMTTSISGIVEASAAPGADEVDRESLSITYTDDPGIEAQVSYVLAHWSNYNSAQYPVLSGVDCANFASQSLIARGWKMDAAWYYDRGTGQMSSAWTSSTALRDHLRTQTDRATELTDAERHRVKVGDLAQFDWDGSGDRDHTAVVTRVERTDSGTKVWVGGHTKDADYWDVDVALATGGGSVSYFSLS
jgi:hypothetical protein